LDVRVDVEQHISDMTHIHIALRIRVKMYRQIHLCGFF